MAKRVRLQALRTIHFEGRDVRAGGFFEASVVDAVVLCHRGKARPGPAGVPVAKAPAAPTYQTRELVADAPAEELVQQEAGPAPSPEPAEEGDSPPTRRRRTYRTRALKAED
jgi:hypothetical protein